ncbi:MAG: hypothetical protein HY875_15130 [Chloroflexi bacterium]|nr:hypothetical protein [Chloroflexota bacterium]
MNNCCVQSLGLSLTVIIAALLSGCFAGDATPGESTVSGNPVAMEPSECPVTVPGEPFLAPPPQPSVPPAYYQSVWYGTARLWTMLRPEGQVWRLPQQPQGFVQKTFWWSDQFSVDGEPRPAITVTGRRLDATGVTFTAGNPGTHAVADFGKAMLVGIDIPTAGCWEIRAEYKGEVLSYVVAVSQQ